jgi:hypothetical protein
MLTCQGTGCKGRRTTDSKELRLAVKQMIVASFASSKVSKFLMVSYLSNRRKKREIPMSDEQWNSIANAQEHNIPIYTKNELEAGEFIDAMAAWRRRQTHLPQGFQAMHVTTSDLSDTQGMGTVELHPESVDVQGEVSRQDVAEVIVRLVERADTDGRYCVLVGEEGIDSAIDKAVRAQESLVDGDVFKNIVGGFVAGRDD